MLKSSRDNKPSPTSTHQNNQNCAAIRDSSRNRLQRLGALYSETENLSSPIHRNEARFDDEMQSSSDAATKAPIKRFGKLAALASSINNWEDDLSHSDTKSQRQQDQTYSPAKKFEPQKSTGTIPKIPKVTSMINKKVIETETSDKSQSKQLKWDKHVMDALEMQGFTRRESTAPKLVYDYKQKNDIDQSTIAKESINTAQVKDLSKKPDSQNNKVTKNFVTERAAIFENSPKSLSGRSQKDPAELSIKERLAIFEQNKGTALVPKAPFAMSVSSKQIASERKVSPPPKFTSTITATNETSKMPAYNKPGKNLK